LRLLALDVGDVRIGVALTVIRVLAIAASIPFWQAMGLFN